MEGRRCVGDGLYDIVAINKGLDELGMLSSISPMRRDYMQDRVLHGIEKLSMVSEDPGQAQQQQPHLAAQQGPHSSWGYSSNSNSSMGSSSRISSDCVPHKAQLSSTHIATSNFSSPSCASASTSHATEKENANLAGFQVLTMNSTFITSFKAGYELPCHVIKEPANIRVYKCSLGKRRRLRTHPYDSKNNSCNVTVIPTTSKEVGEASGSSGYRLRTTSLSSGTSRKKSSPVINGSKIARGNETLAGNKMIKSRSLENISAAVESVEALNLSGPSNLSELLDLSGPSKTQELETVFQGIQQLKMDDHT